jgi:iron complex outermembrane recepter protein
MRLRSALAATVAIAPLALATPALAQSKVFNLPAQPAVTGIPELARQADVQVLMSEAVARGHAIVAVHGTMSIEQALHRALAKTGLHASTTDGHTFIVSSQAERSDGAGTASGEADAGSAPAENPGADIIVTGTQIHGEAPIGAHLTVVDRKAIENSGHATVADYIQTLPQNYSGGSNEANFLSNPHTNDNRAFGSSINLRGLGTESTLVLFDGIRPAMGGAAGAFTDTSVIPTSAIDRIEILADGASAIYGTDAVAGVVNVRFRDHFDGFETHLYSGVAGGALHQEQFSQAAGKRWGSGGLFVAYQYDHRSRLPGDSRSFATEDLRPFGGPDAREPYSLPGTIIAANGETFAIPTGQDGRNLTAGDLAAGQQNLTDLRKGYDILPQQTTNSIYAAFDQKLVGTFRFHARGLYTYRTFLANTPGPSFNVFSVPTTNPFYVDPIGTDQPVSVEYNFVPELGSFRYGGDLKALTTSAGITATFGAWNLDLNGAYGRSRDHETETNGVSATRVAIALADTNPATALNLFGNGSSNNPATLAFIRASYRDFVDSTAWSATFRADGPLFRLPAGIVKLAVGAEHRDDRFSSGYFTNSVEASPDAYDLYQQPGTPEGRRVDAIFGELSVPVWDASGHFPGKLDLSLAGRTDWYSDVGRTTNPKVGLGWTVISGLKVRASWGTSFRAPSFVEKGTPQTNAFYSLLTPDVNSPTGTTPVILLWGYSPSMRPERATSWTAGFDAQFRQVPGLTLSATYFDISYRDRIESPAELYSQILNQPDVYGALIEVPTPAEVAAIYADPRFVDLSGGVPQSDIRYILNVLTQNLARQDIRGVDFNAAYTHDLFKGTFAGDIAGTRLISMTQRFTETSPASNILGTILFPSKLRFRGNLGWSKSGFSIDGFANYTDGYTNNLVTPVQQVGSWTTFDAQIGYRFNDASPLNGARIALSVTNLADRKPPYVEYITPGATMAYDPNQANPIGRQISAELTLQW